MSKRGLVVSGGGSHGAYSVGVIKALTEHGKSWDVMAGVSVGAIICTQMAMYPSHQHKEAAIELEKFWLEEIKGNESIYKKWAPWIFNYLFTLWKGGLHHTKPLLELLKKRFSSSKLLESGVKLKLGTVGLKTGMYRAIPETDVTPEWILASAAMPIIFSPIELDGESWVDGGVRNITPISDVISPDVTEIDVVLADQITDLKFSFSKFKSVIDVGLRCAQIAIDEVFDTDLYQVTYETEHGIKVNVYVPQEPHDYEPFDFQPNKLKAAIEKGYKETKSKILYLNK